MGQEKKWLMAAVAGMVLGVTTPNQSVAGEQGGDVKCYGINSCGSHSKCAVSQGDIDAVKALLGDEFDEQFGNSEVHSCGSHAKCGASSGILNWTPTSATDCHDQGGIVIEEVGGQKVAKKA